MQEKDLPDLKQICKPCPQVDNELKPRKVLNRLPDLDQFVVVKDESYLESVKRKIEKFLNHYNFKTSDVNPVRTMNEVIEIADSLNAGKLPKNNLPIDTHIVLEDDFMNMIGKIPDSLAYARKHKVPPFIENHPLSLRKTWQRDDTAYNFVLDYLLSLTEFNLDPKVQRLLDETRKEVVKKYSFEEIVEFLLSTCSPATKRRFENPIIQERFKDRIEGWEML